MFGPYNRQKHYARKAKSCATLGQADRPRLGVICLQALTVCRLRHDWFDSRRTRIGDEGER
jgi:hypothetical protein